MKLIAQIDVFNYSTKFELAETEFLRYLLFGVCKLARHVKFYRKP